MAYSPIASAYAPINVLNQALAAQDAQQQQGELQRTHMINQFAAEAMNNAVKQQQVKAEQQRYQSQDSLARQQMAANEAYRQQTFGLTAAQQEEAKRQFGLQYELNKKIVDAQIQNPKLDPNAIAGSVDVNKANADAVGTASQVNAALQIAKQKFDGIVATLKTNRHWYTTDAGFNEDVLKAHQAYLDEIHVIATGAQGKITLNRKQVPGPNGTMVESPDEFEAKPVQVPSLMLPGQRYKQGLPPGSDSNSDGSIPGVNGPYPPQAPGSGNVPNIAPPTLATPPAAQSVTPGPGFNNPFGALMEWMRRKSSQPGASSPQIVTPPPTTAPNTNFNPFGGPTGTNRNLRVLPDGTVVPQMAPAPQFNMSAPMPSGNQSNYMPIPNALPYQDPGLSYGPIPNALPYPDPNLSYAGM